MGEPDEWPSISEPAEWHSKKLLLDSRLLFTNRPWLCEPGTLTMNGLTVQVPCIRTEWQWVNVSSAITRG